MKRVAQTREGEQTRAEQGRNSNEQVIISVEATFPTLFEPLLSLRQAQPKHAEPNTKAKLTLGPHS